MPITRAFQRDIAERDYTRQKPLVDNLETFAREALTTSPWTFTDDILAALSGLAAFDTSTIGDGIHASAIVEAAIRQTIPYLGVVEANRVGMAIVMAWNAKRNARDAQLKAFAYLGGAS